MGQVVPFIRRVRDSADWTAEERARLETLADRLADAGVDVEVVFGATDDGDPWCAVTDADGEVLIHVARIDGRFVVHSAVDDVLSEGADLHAVLRERLDAAEAEPKSAVILPFAQREGQAFLALVVAAAFFYETVGFGDAAEAAELAPLSVPATDPVAPPPQADAPAQERRLAAQGVALHEPEARTQVGASSPAAAAAPPAPATASDAEYPAALAAPPASEPEPTGDLSAAPEPVRAFEGTAGDDLIVGAEADERLAGGSGCDTLQGGGGQDTLQGGAGDDRIELTAEAVAEGGEGADTFVVLAHLPPRGPGGPLHLLGTVLDFDFDAGDRLVTAAGRWLEPPRPPPGGDFGVTLTPPDHPPGPPIDGMLPSGFGPPLTRVEVDLDGDGTNDGYLLVEFVGRGEPIAVTGQTLTTPDPFG